MEPLSSDDPDFARKPRFVAASAFVVLISAVCDGWSGKPRLLLHQLLLLPLLGLYAFLLVALLRPKPNNEAGGESFPRATYAGRVGIALLVAFESASLLLFSAEFWHFQQFGYRLRLFPVVLIGFGGLLAGLAMAGLPLRWKRVGQVWLTSALLIAAAIECFPLNYLRSDMLPVIMWADGRLLAHLNPYTTMHVGHRVYDFPYLPGMLVAYLPVLAMHLDPRIANIVYLGGIALLFAWTARSSSYSQVAWALGLFLLCPFLQYRHDLYLEPHWFLVCLALVLMQRRRFLLAAFVWGSSCALYQLSWVLLPFAVLNAYRRKGVGESAKTVGIAAAGFLLVAGPFLGRASAQIQRNTIGQWNGLSHALADPINLSYWLTYIIRPDELRWVQAAVLIGIFCGCARFRRCGSTTDTLRWMIVALAVFIPLNILVDGYFYLTLQLLVVIFTCMTNGWWVEGEQADAVKARPAGTAIPNGESSPGLRREMT